MIPQVLLFPDKFSPDITILANKKIKLKFGCYLLYKCWISKEMKNLLLSKVIFFNIPIQSLGKRFCLASC